MRTFAFSSNNGEALRGKRAANSTGARMMKCPVASMQHKLSESVILIAINPRESRNSAGQPHVDLSFQILARRDKSQPSSELERA